MRSDGKLSGTATKFNAAKVAHSYGPYSYGLYIEFYRTGSIFGGTFRLGIIKRS